MRILMIAPTPFFADRGCHTQIYEEIRALQKIGHEVLLCTYGLGREVEGVHTVRTINFPWYRKLAAGPSYTKILLLPCLTVTTLMAVVRFKPQVVHAHLHEGAVIARICKFFFPGLRVLFDMQGSLTGETLQHRFVRKGSIAYRCLAWLERRIAGWFPVITQSETMIQELKSLGVPETGCFNVRDGVDTDTFCETPFDTELGKELGISRESPRILYMGLLEEYQGVDVMLKAFSILAKMRPNTRFIIIGYPNVDKYKALALSLGIDSHCLFLGRIEYQRLPRYLSLSQVAVAPKIAETEGDGKIYNYMAMGMTTVAFDRGVSREILADSGVFARFGDPQDLAEKLLSVIDDYELCRAKGRASRQRAVENLSWDAVGRRIDRVYSNICTRDFQRI